MRAILTGLGAWALSGLLAAAAAEGTSVRPLMTADDTRGFEAIGRLDLGPLSFCTATLIRDDLVLTAAHCLFEPDSRRPRDLAEMEFRAGFRDGRALAYRGVRRAFVHPEYVYEGNDGSAMRVVNDLALLELDRPIRNGSVTPIATATKPRKGDAVGVVSYAIDREARPSLEDGCQVLARPANMLVISCTVDFGSSGAPILSFASGEPRIVSVVSAKAEARGKPVSLGTDLEEPLAELMELAAGGVPVSVSTTAQASAPVIRRIGSADGSAKFIRP